MYSFTEENYLKAIYKLSSEQGISETSTNAIAEELETRAASVTDMLKKLNEKDLVVYEKYKGVRLSDAGLDVAMQVVRKHRLWEVFLHDKLQFGWEEVHEIAEQLEHIQSDRLINRLDDYLGNPTHDPHGDPIPDQSGNIKKDQFIALSKLDQGTRCILTGVTDHSVSFLKSVERWGLGIGTSMRIGEKNEFDGTLELILSENKVIVIGQKSAAHILVKRA
ncbi:MAG: metal-dependent transcriptional regulator [Bacteroidota bacterium]|nr:metal-dependent transcriptional regulator [Bacteroidota bacterium]MDX5431485.1 metal-dependent transcriptional regulator [Bacteroidota bacterium]MDX5470209.1 metal-dependent transcriptional regulator [Bacteroidota bacterium]